ncbi:dihydroorotase [Spongiimicrobium sp. 2-473A-2-J]|uniref:dihydroorotase n=1 Tax=Eudoraea algarum TaxID=3417568 RepID=UPI003D36B0B8
MSILLKSAKIVDPGNRALHLKKRDILIKNGGIERIASKIEATGKAKVISRKNLCVSAGWFDSSVSMGEPGYEERETIANGLTTAAKSGYTHIVLNPNTHPIPDSSSDIVFLKNTAQPFATALHPLGALTMGSEGNDLAELFDMQNAGAVGFYDHKKAMKNANLLKIALQYAQNFGGLVYSFPLDTHISGKGTMNEGAISTKLGLKGIPSLAEEIQIARDLFILEYAGGRLHIPTISTAKSVSLIAEAKKKGLDVSCSVAIHNLWYTDEVLETFDTNYKVMPPLRNKTDIKALLKGLKNGTIDFVSSDHTPIDIEEKRVVFDHAEYGSLGLENAFGLLNQIFDLETTIGLLTKGRERYGMETPSIREGENACLTLFDPDLEYTFGMGHILSTSKNSMFLDTPLRGKVYGVFAKNQLVLSA